METRQRRPQGDDPSSPQTSKPASSKQSAIECRVAQFQSLPLWQKVVVSLGTVFTLLFLFILLKPLPYKIHTFKPMAPAPEWTGPLAYNNLIANAERLLEDVIHGPESMTFLNDKVYMAQSDGFVSELDLKTMKLRNVVRFGRPPCVTLEDEYHCGRPLGMRFDKNNHLWVMDAYLGIFKITNLQTGAYETILKSDVPIGGELPMMLNDVDFGPGDIIYFTDSSTKFWRYEYTNVGMCGAHVGRLVQLNVKTGEMKILMRDLAFPNGIAVDRSGNVLVTDSFYNTIVKYDVKTGQTSMWHASLPGTPDNIRYQAESGTYLVGLSHPREAGKKDEVNDVNQSPWLRWFLAKFITVRFVEGVERFKEKMGMIKCSTLVVEMNEQGEIIKSFQDHTGTGVLTATEAHVYKGDMFLGNFGAHYLGRVKGITLAGKKGGK